ncbi:aldolase/citrate lyase family protein [Ornithinimicrobium humiphilum]|uniref:HpcH/HpaI aldolase/citrate lyase family protein n=1 Tax=Ornithinimicrobium humiphilum TaxID=125288 RepID=A0A543KN86_9MICO|nr:HpcH/HpaI aldolase/citrate lyase family protein [Ornithinimicrobium humiphilum]
MSDPDLTAALTAELDEMLREADAKLVARFPGDAPTRQPVHTVYVPADRYDADLVARWGEEARTTLTEHEGALADLLGGQADEVLPLVADKLASEPIEDLRVDLEDGYGPRPDDVEDGHVDAAASALARTRLEGTAPPFSGIRFKSLEAPTRARGVRSLTRFVDGLVSEGDDLDGVVVTLPKVTSLDQVAAMVHACERLEAALGLAPGTLRFEIQVETPQSILGPDGTALVARMIHAGASRVTGLHYGTYDYSAYCGVAGPYQSLEHPVADHAKLVMQAAAAGTGVRLSDGSTNVLPVGDAAQVRDAWALHSRLVRRSLERGYYQGWDLHPGHLPSRFAATYAFYREHLPAAGARLRAYLGRTGGGVLDEPATARALADLVVRALDCGAVRPAEAEEATGVATAELLALARPRRA